MKFNVGSKPLQQQLQAVSRVINSKNALNILDNFLFEVEGDTLTITGSDQENVMTARLPIMESDGDGAIALPAKRLLEIVKEVPGQGLTFYINEQTFEVDIKFVNGRFTFMGVDAAEFPRKAQMGEDTHSLTIPASVIDKGIGSTLFAVSPDQIRPIMTGIFWDIHPTDITFVASDTHKLVRYINREVAPGLETGFIMPSKPAGILRGLVAKEEGDVNLTIDNRSATFEIGDYSLSCRFINGNYPDYRRVIPEGNPFELTVDRGMLLAAMRRVALFASMASSLVRINVQHGEMLLASQDLDYARSADERVTCDYEGNVMTIGFNAPYMIEVLSNLPSETICIQLSDPSRPGLFVPDVQEDNSDLVMLLMPMQVLDY